MGTYSLGRGNLVTVYAFQTGVYLRRWSGHYTARPQLLAKDYRADLSDVFWRETVYYGYRNQMGEYLVRDASQPEKKYVLRPGESMGVYSPQLILYREKLMVFYIEEKEWEGGCRLRVAPLGEEKKVEFPGEYDYRPEFKVFQWGEELLLGVGYHRDWKCYRWCPGYTWEEMAGWKYWRERKQKELEGRQFQNREEIEILQENLQYRNQLIESIKTQYEELMDTATRYREEAKKWRDQYIAVCGRRGGRG